MWSQLWEEHCYTSLPWVSIASPSLVTAPPVAIASTITCIAEVVEPLPTPPAKPSPTHSTTTANHLPRELMNLLPPPVSKCEQLLLKAKQEKETASNLTELIKKTTYRQRSESEERLCLLLCKTNGFDREDLHFFKRTFEVVKEGDSINELDTIIKRLKWVDHPETSSSHTQMAARTRNYSKKEDRMKAKANNIVNITNKGNSSYSYIYIY